MVSPSAYIEGVMTGGPEAVEGHGDDGHDDEAEHGEEDHAE
jgi:hypothetical protein